MNRTNKNKLMDMDSRLVVARGEQEKLQRKGGVLLYWASKDKKNSAKKTRYK